MPNYLKISFIAFFLAILAFKGYTQSSQIQNFANTTLSSNIGGFSVYTPADYATTQKYYPLMIFCHGLGEAGDGSYPFTGMTQHGPLKEIKFNNTVAGLNNQFIIIAPQYKGYVDSPAGVESTINYAISHYRIRGKAFVTGLSMGGGVTWNAASSNTVSKLAAAAPMAGSVGSTPEKAATIAGNNLPIWAFHGTADNDISVTVSSAWINRINTYTSTPNPLAKLTTFLGVGHNCWSAVYAGYVDTFTGMNLYEWMLSQDKSPFQTIAGVANLGNKMISEVFNVGFSASSGLVVSYKIKTNPSVGVIATLTGNNVSCVGIGVVTITAFQEGSSEFRAANEVNYIFNIGHYIGTLSGLPAANQPIVYGELPLSISGGNGTFPLKLMAKTQPNGRVVSISGTTIYTLGVGNVTVIGIINNQTTTSTFKIVPRPLTVTAHNFSRNYGTSNPIFTSSVLGLVNGDAVAVAYFTLASSVSGIGIYVIIPSVTGSSLINYELITDTGTLLVKPSPLNISVGNAYKVYGAENPSFSSTIAGLLNGDAVAVTYFTLASSVSGTGNYVIIPSVTGSSLINYELITDTGTLLVKPSPLNISVGNAYKVYGAENPSFSSTIAGLVNADTLHIEYQTSASPISSSGIYPITISIAGVAISNYNVSIAGGSMYISKALLTVVAFNQVKYASEYPFAPFLYSITGFVYSDTESSFTNPIQISSTANAEAAPGFYPIDMGGVSSTNYDFSFKNGVLTILKPIEPPVVLVPIVNKILVFDSFKPNTNITLVGQNLASVTNVCFSTEFEAIVCVHPQISNSIMIEVKSPVGAKYGTITLLGTFGVERINMDITITANESTPVKDFKIYPNPSQGKFYVETSARGELDIVSLLGKKLLSYKVNGNTSFAIDEKGIYLLVFKSAQYSLTKLIMVE